jgi:hypothetical protein
MPPSRPRLINLLTRIPQFGARVRNAHDAWLRRRINKYWQREHKTALQLFEPHKPVLTEIEQRVLAELTACGIAQVRYDELLPDRQLWDALSAQVDEWLESDKIKEIEKRYIESDHREAKWKEYIVMMTAEKGCSFSIDSPLLQLALQPAILNIVNSYFGVMARLFHLDVWKTIPLSPNRPLTGSQRCHRDPEDLKLVKVFFYLTDVEKTAGPLHYLKYSRLGDKYGDLWPQKVPYGSVAPADEVEVKAPRTDRVVCSAPAGTFIFADTTGLHMGGRAVEGERVFATWGFASPGTVWPKSFRLERHSVTDSLPLAAKYALFESL